MVTESLFFPQRYLNRVAQVVALDCYDFVVVTLRFDLELQTTHMNRQQHNNPVIIRRAPAFAEETVRSRGLKLYERIWNWLAILVKHAHIGAANAVFRFWRDAVARLIISVLRVLRESDGECRHDN